MSISGGAAAIELRGVEATVPDGPGRRTILGGVDLLVAPGESLAITGPSGSGKSTLLAIAGLMRRIDDGEVLLEGRATVELRDRERTSLRRDRIAFVYQAANLLPSLTAREQLELVAHIRREPRREARSRADALLADVGLGGRADQLPGEMSGGERQRVAIARALMSRPAVILADEPTASLDPDLALEINGLLASRAREQGLATVIVTHDETSAEMADRRLHLAEGSLLPVPEVAEVP
ncbi:MAG TPA: ABC transporter ATP-binding protein [Solirubrobacterales bacterium]|nr:ABC transporter ATP-binding protein [Solirubrobacterales bacterium]